MYVPVVQIRWLNRSPRSTEEWAWSAPQSLTSPSRFRASRRSSPFSERGQIITLIPCDRGSFWESPGGSAGGALLWGPSGSLKAAGAGTICRPLTAGGFGRTSGETGPGDCRATGDGEWVCDGVVGGVWEAGLTGEGGAAHDLLDCGECFGLGTGPASTSSFLSRPSFLRASIRTFWGSMDTRSPLVGAECPARLSGAGAALCDFRIMLAGSFLGLGATTGGLLGSVVSGEGLGWTLVLTDPELCSGGSFSDSWVSLLDARWRRSSRSTGLFLDVPAGRGGSLVLSGGPGSSMKSDGGGMRLKSISEFCPRGPPVETICRPPFSSLDKYNILGWRGAGPTSRAAGGSASGAGFGEMFPSLRSGERVGVEASSSPRCSGGPSWSSLGSTLTWSETPQLISLKSLKTQAHTEQPPTSEPRFLGRRLGLVVGQPAVLLHLQSFDGFLQVHETRPLLGREVLHAVFALQAKRPEKSSSTLPSTRLQKAKVVVCSNTGRARTPRLLSRPHPYFPKVLIWV